VWYGLSEVPVGGLCDPSGVREGIILKSVNRVWLAVSVCSTLALRGAGIVRAGGGVNPPAGPVAPTMHTLDDIFTQSARSTSGTSTSVIGDLRGVGVMTVTGVTQGPIVGEDFLQGMAEMIKVLGFSHEVTVPFDPATGIVTGVPHESTPFVIVKQIDSATPRFLQAAMNLEEVAVDLQLYRPNSVAAGDVLYFTYRLLNAHIVGIRPFTISVNNGQVMHLEEVTFVYSRIELTHVLDAIQVISNW